MREPTWQSYCRACGTVTVAFEEDAEVHTVKCRLCGRPVQVPYFSDGQLQFIFISLVVASILTLGCVLIVTSG